MGFMDRAKKMAEQAQEKLDEVQKDFNERQAGATPAGEPEAPVAPAAPAPQEPAKPPTPPSDMPTAPPGGEDHAPPRVTGGDPLAG